MTVSNLDDAKVLQELAKLPEVFADNQRELLERIAAQLQSDAKRYEESKALQDIGKGAYESIAEMVAALECDYDRLSELREARDDLRKTHSDAAQAVRDCGPFNDADESIVEIYTAETDAREALANWDDAEELAELESAAGDCESRDDAEQRIHEDPLSIELSGTWSLGETPTADRAIILLGTGGPATRIVCELDEHREPHRAWIQAQDWFKPWTDYVGSHDGETLLTYCRCFFFGEG
jgi:hypothetical protein